MLALSSSENFTLYVPPTDMRKGFGRLCGLIRSEIVTEPSDGSVYIFINKFLNKTKLHRQSVGFIRYYKRLEKGTVKLPVYDSSVLSLGLDYTDIVLLMDGETITNINRSVRYKKEGIQVAFLRRN